MDTWVGVDIGLTGAIAVIQGNNIKIWDMPIRELPKVKSGGLMRRDYSITGILCVIQEIEKLGQTHYMIEKVSARPGQGIVSTGSLYRGLAIFEALLTSQLLLNEYQLVWPATWKKVMVPEAGDDKERSVAAALRLFPQSEGYFKRKKDHGRAEALLLAEWGRRHAKGGL